jgi:hypothetical protein
MVSSSQRLADLRKFSYGHENWLQSPRTSLVDDKAEISLEVCGSVKSALVFFKQLVRMAAVSEPPARIVAQVPARCRSGRSRADRETAAALVQLRETTDPFVLAKIIKEKLARIWAPANRCNDPNRVASQTA